jgi:hypothetical protein
MEIIQSMWVGSRLSAMERMCIKSYLHHGHQFHLYVYQDTEGIPEGTVVLDGNLILPSSKIFTYEGSGFGRKSYAGFADMFRYKLLLTRGNWWVDTDSICLRPFDFASEYVFSSEQPPADKSECWNINCGNLKAPMGSEIYEWLHSQCQAVDPRMHWGAIGPQLMKRAVEKFKLHQYVQRPQVFCPVPFDDKCDNLLKDTAVWEPTKDNYAVHLWNEGWRSNGLDKEAQYKLGCLYERLKRRYGIIGSGPIASALKVKPTMAGPVVPPKDDWKKTFLGKKVDRLVGMGFNVAVCNPGSTMLDSLRKRFPAGIEENIETPLGKRVLFCLKAGTSMGKILRDQSK